MSDFRNILLNYAVYNPTMGYTQGMSDLLAPLLATIHNEVASFWCFVGLMEFSMFATTPTDDAMDTSLVRGHSHMILSLRFYNPSLFVSEMES